MERSQEQSSLVRQEEETLRGISYSLDVPHGREKSKQEIPSLFGGSGSFVQPLYSRRVDKGMNLTLFLCTRSYNALLVVTLRKFQNSRRILFEWYMDLKSREIFLEGKYYREISLK